MNGKKLLFLFLFISLLVKNIFSQELKNKWVSPIQGAYSEFTTAFKLDKEGNVFATGFFEGTVDFDPTTAVKNFTAMGDWYSDVFICKYDKNGKLIWVKQIGGMLTEKSTDLELDDDGNIYVAGTFESTVDFDPNDNIYTLQSNGSKDGFILKLDKDGGFDYVKNIGSFEYDRITDLVLDKNFLFAIGDFQDSVNFDKGASNFMASSMGSSDVCIIKYTLGGSFQWMKQTEGLDNDFGEKITLDKNGNIFATGTFEGTVDFDPSTTSTYYYTSFPPPIIGAPKNDIFVLKLSNSGSFIWAKQIGGYGDDMPYSINCNSKNEYYITGSIGSTSYFSLPNTTTNSLTNNAENAYFISKFTTDDSLIFAKPFGGKVNSLCFDSDENLLLSGHFNQTANFNPDTLSTVLMTSAAPFDMNIFISKLDKQGNYIFAKQISSKNGCASMHIETDAQNNIYHCGIFYGITNFEPTIGNYDITAIQYSDGFLQKLGICFLFDTTINLTACDSLVFKNNIYSSSGNYEITTHDKQSCDSVFHLSIIINKIEPTIYYSTSSSCQKNNEGKITISNPQINYTYSLFPSNSIFSNNEFTNLKSGTYNLLVEDENKCKEKYSIDVMQESCCDNPYLPSAFSPNGDNVNDEFKILHISNIELQNFSIYNRYGNEVFKAKHEEDRWDGKQKGMDAEVGTYYYYIKYLCKSSGKTVTLKGDILLLR